MDTTIIVQIIAFGFSLNSALLLWLVKKVLENSRDIAEIKALMKIIVHKVLNVELNCNSNRRQ